MAKMEIPSIVVQHNTGGGTQPTTTPESPREPTLDQETTSPETGERKEPTLSKNDSERAMSTDEDVPMVAAATESGDVVKEKSPSKKPLKSRLSKQDIVVELTDEGVTEKLSEQSETTTQGSTPHPHLVKQSSSTEKDANGNRITKPAVVVAAGGGGLMVASRERQRIQLTKSGKQLIRSQALCDDTSPPPPEMLNELMGQQLLALQQQYQAAGNTLTVVKSASKQRLPLGKQGSSQSSQGSMDASSSSPGVSRDSSFEQYMDSTGIDLTQFIIDTLHKNQKDRSLLLKIEQDLINFVRDPSGKLLKFPLMSSYQRMLVHRCAAYFGMDHNVDPVGTSVIVNKTKSTRIPDMRFRDQIRDDLLMSDEPKRSILKRNSSSKTDSSFEDGCNSPERQLSTDNGNRRSKSFEEREEEYERARARIFNQDSSSSQEGAIDSPIRSYDGTQSSSSRRSSQEDLRAWGVDARPWSSTDSSDSSHPPRLQRQLMVRSQVSSMPSTDYSDVSMSSRSSRHQMSALLTKSESAEGGSQHYLRARPIIVPKASSFGGISVLHREDSEAFSVQSAGPRLLTHQESVASQGSDSSNSQMTVYQQPQATTPVQQQATATSQHMQQGGYISTALAAGALAAAAPTTPQQINPFVGGCQQYLPPGVGQPMQAWQSEPPPKQQQIQVQQQPQTNQQPTLSQGQPVIWAVSNLESVPPGSILINSATGQPFTNPDGSIYRHNSGAAPTAPVPPPPPPQQQMPTNVASVNQQTQQHGMMTPQPAPPPQGSLVMYQAQPGGAGPQYDTQRMQYDVAEMTSQFAASTIVYQEEQQQQYGDYGQAQGQYLPPMQSGSGQQGVYYVTGQGGGHMLPQGAVVDAGGNLVMTGGQGQSGQQMQGFSQSGYGANQQQQVAPGAASSGGGGGENYMAQGASQMGVPSYYIPVQQMSSISSKPNTEMMGSYIPMGASSLIQSGGGLEGGGGTSASQAMMAAMYSASGPQAQQQQLNQQLPNQMAVVSPHYRPASPQSTSAFSQQPPPPPQPQHQNYFVTTPSSYPSSGVFSPSIMHQQPPPPVQQPASTPTAPTNQAASNFSFIGQGPVRSFGPVSAAFRSSTPPPAYLPNFAAAVANSQNFPPISHTLTKAYSLPLDSMFLNKIDNEAMLASGNRPLMSSVNQQVVQQQVMFPLYPRCMTLMQGNPLQQQLILPQLKSAAQRLQSQLSLGRPPKPRKPRPPKHHSPAMKHDITSSPPVTSSPAAAAMTAFSAMTSFSAGSTVYEVLGIPAGLKQPQEVEDYLQDITKHEGRLIFDPDWIETGRIYAVFETETSAERFFTMSDSLPSAGKFQLIPVEVLSETDRESNDGSQASSERVSEPGAS